MQPVVASTVAKTPKRFSRKLASALHATKQVVGLSSSISSSRLDRDDDEDPDWGCWEAMAISRAHSAASLNSSIISSPSLTYSPSGSTLSSSSSSGSIDSDYFSPSSPPRVAFVEFENPRPAPPAPRPALVKRERVMFDIVEEDESEDEALTFPVTPSVIGSPTGAQRFSATPLFPTTPVFSTSPALPALPAGASFKSSFEEAMNSIEVSVDIASLSIEQPASPKSRCTSRDATLREPVAEARSVVIQAALEAEDASCYALEMTALPADYEEEDESDISLYYTSSDESSSSCCDADFSLEQHSRCSIATAELYLKSITSFHEEKLYARVRGAKARPALPRADSPTSPLSREARVRHALISGGLPGYAF